MDKYDVEYRMYSLKSFCEIFDELLDRKSTRLNSSHQI